MAGDQRKEKERREARRMIHKREEEQPEGPTAQQWDMDTSETCERMSTRALLITRNLQTSFQTSMARNGIHKWMNIHTVEYSREMK